MCDCHTHGAFAVATLGDRPIRPPTHLPIHPLIHPPIRPPIHPPIHPSIHPSIHAPTHAPTQTPTHPSIHPSNLHPPYSDAPPAVQPRRYILDIDIDHFVPEAMYPGIPPWGRSGVDEGFSCLDATLGACGEELGEPHSILTCGADGCISPRARDQIELELESDPSPSSSPLLSFTPSPLHPPFVRTISYRGVLQFATSGCACRVALLGTHPGCLKTRWADPACPVWREMDRVVADIELEGSVKVPPQPEASGETTISADCSLALGRYWRTAMMGPHTDELRCLWGALWPAEWVSTPAPARGAGRWAAGSGHPASVAAAARRRRWRCHRCRGLRAAQQRRWLQPTLTLAQTEP